MSRSLLTDLRKLRNILAVCLGALSLTLQTGCGKKDVIAPPYPTDSIGRINRWIEDSMRRYYYWSDNIPGRPDYAQGSDAFFRSLLSSNDRFSWVSNGADIAAASNSYFIYGFHYAFVQVTDYNGLVGVVTSINSGGPADRAGFRRGSYFLAVNGQKVTAGNMEAVNRQLSEGASVRITSGAYTNNEWTTVSDTILYAGFRLENVVQHTRTFSSGGITTGYLYYSSFDEGWDTQLLQAVGKLKQAGIRELVLDLRYNAGGSVASSAKLACLVASALKGSETYAIYAGNHWEGKSGRSLQEVLNTSTNSAGRSFADLQPLKLPLNRVFILTTRATVSAAELVVNNLRPFLPVIQIGETTRGKNEAGFIIEDLRNPREVFWKMEPTVYKLFNKNNEGNYENGLTPQYPVSELAQLPLAGIGDANDPLLRKALEIIYGSSQLPGNFIELGARHKSIINAVPVYRSTDEQGNFSIMHCRRFDNNFLTNH